MEALLHSPLMWAGLLVAQFLLSAVADSLPEPDSASTKKYLFWFKFLHRCAANFSRVRKVVK